MICRKLQQLSYPRKHRLLSLNHTGIGRNRNFTIGKSIQCINGNIRRNARSKVNGDLYFSSRIIRNFFDFYFACIIGFNDAINQLRSGSAERNIFYDESPLIVFFDPGTYAHFTSSHSIIIMSNIYHSAGGKIRIEFKLFSFIIFYSRFN